MELKGKREVFCREYLAKQLNGTKAALAAGYSSDSARTIASQLLAMQDIQDRIAELATERNEELKVDAREIIEELLRLLRTDPSLACDENGAVKSIHDIPIDLRRAIASFEVEHTLVGTTTKVKFWNKERAIEMLARHLALFKDSLDLGVKKDLDASDVETSGRVAAILEDAGRRRDGTDDLV